MQQRRVLGLLVRGLMGISTASGLAMAAGLAMPSIVSVGVAQAQNLPTDDRLVTGELDNGMKYIVRKHAVPPGRAAMYLHVSSGSLNETDKQRGIAHYLEHMAFNGSQNFPPGSVVPFFQSMGLSFGRHQNAFTSFDQTAYQLEMPDNKPETMEKAFAFFADVATRLSLLPHEIDEERQIILEEKRTRAGADQRVQEYIFERMAPGSIFGQRMPIGTEESLLHMGEQDFKDYYTKWYVPSNMTLLVVADADEKQVVELINKTFGGGERKQRPADQDVGIKAQTAPRAIVASDAELTEASISIDRIEPPNPATLTVPQLKQDLTEQLAQMCFDRRMERKINEGKLKTQDVSVSAGEIAGAIRISSVSASGDPTNWKQMLTEVGTELQRARIHGFTTKELEDAKARLISGAERSVQIEPTMQAAMLLRMMNARVAAGEPIMAPAQRLKLVQELVPQIELKDVSWAFSKMFDPANATFVAQLPTSAEVPSEADFLKLGLAAVSVEPAAEDVVAGAKTILEKDPAPGKVTQTSDHAATGVRTAVLENNILAHHRFMDYKKNEATIVITLAGGEIEETAENRGVTQAATLALSRPATGRLSSNDVTDLFAGKKVAVRGGAGRDLVSISVSGDPAELDLGMQLAYALLTDAKIEQPAFEQWKTETALAIADRKKQPGGMIQEAMTSTMSPPGEVRLRPIEKDQLDKITLEQAQSWLTRIMTSAPIEVSVVGDIDQEKAMSLVGKYLGALPKREAMSDKTLDDKRNIKRPVGPLVNHVEMPTQTPVAVVINGFFGADQSELKDTRLLQIAARVLSTRMITVIREQEQLVYSIQASSVPGTDYPGYGMFIAPAPTDPAKTEALDKRISAMYAEFAQGGPTDDEMVVARKQFANNFDEQLREPGYWSSRLSTMAYRATNLDDILSGPEAFQHYTAAEVKDAFAKYYKPEATMSIIVKPASAKPAEAPAAKPAAPDATK